MNSVRVQAQRLTAEEYDGVSRSWDRYFVRATAQARDQMIRMARLKTGERVLDIGTGTGASAILAAHKVGKTGRVLGIDLSKRMLRRAKKNAANMKLANVAFRHMDSTSLKLPNESVDAIITSFGAPEGPYDARIMLKEWSRVLSRHGRLCFCEGGDGKAWNIIDRVVDKYKVAHPDRQLAERRRLKRLIARENKRTPLLCLSNLPKLRRQMHNAGFRNVRKTTKAIGWTFPSTKALLTLVLSTGFSHEYAAMTVGAQRDFKERFSRSLKPFETSRGLCLGGRVSFLQADKNGAHASTRYPGWKLSKIAHGGLLDG